VLLVLYLVVSQLQVERRRVEENDERRTYSQSAIVKIWNVPQRPMCKRLSQQPMTLFGGSEVF
jgi:hypothetical protein